MISEIYFLDFIRVNDISGGIVDMFPITLIF